MPNEPSPHDLQGFTARHRHALDRLGSAQKSSASVPAYLRFVNRPLGGRIAAVGFGLGATPNQLTAISAACSFGALAWLALAAPTWPVSIAIALLLLVGYAFDSADGQLSRVRGGGTPAGEWLDHVVDVAKTATFHAAVAVSLFRFPGGTARGWLLLPLGFLILHVTFFFAMMLRDQLGARPKKVPGASAPLVTAVLLLPLDYGTLAAVIALRAEPTLFLLGYGGLGAVLAVFCLRSLPKAYRSLAHP